MKNLAKAVIAVMKEVKGMEKNSRVGTGQSAYDGTKDQDVKEVFNEVMAKHGLCILPIGIEESTQIDRWEEEDAWSKSTPKAMKTKQSVFTKVTTKYLLLHESGESQELVGYGQGVDPQDKGAGKSTTYALKNCLLYTFLTPVGKMDDTDTKHSNEHTTPPTKQTETSTTKPQPKQAPKKELPTLVKDSKEWKSLEGYIASGKLTDVSKISLYSVSPELKTELEALISAKANEGGRLPNLTKDQFESAKTMKPNEILKLLAEHRMTPETREALTKMAKK